MRLDEYITGEHDPDAPFNQADLPARDYAEVVGELDFDDANIIEEELDLARLELSRLKMTMASQKARLRDLLDIIEGMESHTYVKNILKDIFL